MTSRLIRWTGPLAALVLLTVGLLPATAARAAAPHQLIVGSGSSWAANAVNQWIADVHGDGLQVAYTANGSAAGRQDFGNDTVDYAVSDLPYQGTDPATGASDTAQGRTYTSVPLAGNGLSFPYHLEVGGQLLRTLRLSGASIAGIFTGAIRFWDDPRIVADNRGRLALPHLAVLPVVHSEGSATSFRLGHYLSTQYPQAWGSRGAPSPYFPTPADAVTEAGSDGVMNMIASGAGNGSIGYDEYSYALGRGYPVAAVQNRAGDFVLPVQGNVAVALRSASAADFDTGDLSDVYASSDPRAYPLSSWTSALIPTASDDRTMTTAKRNTLASFLGYSLCTGQGEMGRVGYAPLPLNLVEAGFDGVRALGQADPNVDLTDLDVQHCAGNSTFTPGATPHDDLDSVFPYPPACAGPDQGPCGVPADATTLTAPAGVTVLAGRSAVVSTRLVDVSTHRALGGVAVTLWQRAAGTPTWRLLSSGRASAGGVRSVRVRPRVSSEVQFRYAGDADHAAAVTTPAALRVRSVVTLHTTSVRVRRNARIVLWGTVAPAHAGRVDTLQVLRRGRWALLGHVTERGQRDPDGRYRLSFASARRFAVRGTYRVRVLRPGSVDALGSASAALTLVVR